MPVVISSVNWGYPSSGDTYRLATVAYEAILGGEKMTTTVTSVARFFGVCELVNPKHGELAEVRRTERALVRLFVCMSSHVNLQLSTCG